MTTKRRLSCQQKTALANIQEAYQLFRLLNSSTVMSSAGFNQRNESPSPSSPPKKRVKQSYTTSIAPAMARALASDSSFAAAPAPTTRANGNRFDLSNLSEPPHTPPNAPRKVRDENHPAPYDIIHKPLFDKLYKEVREDMKEKGLGKSRTAILKYARERLIRQERLLANRTQVMHDLARYNTDRNQDIKDLNENIECCHTMINYNAGQIERQACQLSEQEKEITEKDEIVKEGKDRILEQQKRHGYLEALLVEHGWTKEWMEYAVERMEKTGESAREVVEAVEKAE
jgi:hypothetical protein